MTQGDLRSKRLLRLGTEMSEEQADLQRVLSSALSNDAAAIDMVMQEVLYALYVPRHEGRRPPYGCLISTIVSQDEELGTVVKIDDQRLDEARALADGRDLLLHRSTTGQVTLLLAEVIDELAAMRLVRDWQGAYVQRLDTGIVKVFGSRGVLSNEGREWTLQASASSALASTARGLTTPKGGPDQSQVLTLLELCYHRLSPLGIGATFVLDLSGDTSDLLGSLVDQGKAPVLSLNSFDPTSHIALRNLLAMADGACLVASSGDVRRYEVKLPVSQRAMELIGQHGGTRHTSAKRYTYDHGEVIAIVVSADGPVTLFSDGVELLRLGRGSGRLSWLLREPKGGLRSMGQTTRDETCQRCEKRLRVREVIRSKSGSRQHLHCPVCQAEIQTAADCVEATAWPLKPWERARRNDLVSVRAALPPQGFSDQ